MMKKILFGIVALGVVALVPTTAHAICGVPISFGQIYGPCDNGNSCYVTCSGQASYYSSDALCNYTTASLDGNFWALGFGAQATGSGDDNGTWDDSGWLTRFGAAYNWYMTGTWAQDAGIDGCIDAKVKAGKTLEVMVAGFSDQDPSGTTGYYGVAATDRAGAASPQFNFGHTNGGSAGPAAWIDLKPIPKPFITGSTRVSSTSTNVTVRCDTDSGAIYNANSQATAAELVSGCNFYTQVVARAAAAPSNRLATSGWTLGASSVAPGATGTVSLTCAADSDAYIATAIVYESGFETAHVSSNSTRVECGPNVAEPRETQFRLIKNRREGVERKR